MAPEMMIVKNNPSIEYWNIEDGYKDISINITSIYPYRVFGAGISYGLEIGLVIHKMMLDYVCRGPIQGFKILLHMPGEMPQLSKYIRVPNGNGVLISVKPQIIITSKSLQKYNPNRRGCFFNSERKLQFFKLYTQQKCELECLANFTQSLCGCVKFSMPSKR